MKIAWVTGAKGFIGRHLARKLEKSGAIVAGVGHGAWVESDAAAWGINYWINGDVSQANLDRLMQNNGKPSAIFHLAGGSAVGLSMQTPMEDFQRSVVSTKIILEWVRNHAPEVPIILPSSAAVYGTGHKKPISETCNISPFSPYGYHKRIAELLCESYSLNFGLKTAVVRLLSVYGPELHKQLLWDLCIRLRTDPDIIVLSGTGQERRDWLHVEDATKFLISAVSYADEKGFVVNGGSGLATSVKDIAEQVRDFWGVKTTIEFNSISRPGDPFYLVADMKYGHSIKFVSKIDWKEGIKEYVSWFRS